MLGVTTTMHFEPDRRTHVIFDAGDWDHEMTLPPAPDYAAARRAAYAWIATLPTEEELARRNVPAVHFIGFRGEEYWSAVRIWGRPSFIHMGWDRRAQRDIADGDVVVFACGGADRPIGPYNFPDTKEVLP